MALALGVFLYATSSAELVMAAGNQTGASVSNQSQQSANQTNSTNPFSKIPVIGKLFGGK